MKYPAIYQSTVNGNVILLFNDKQGVTLDKFKATVGTSGEWDEDKFKNITAEYLANTYGEVKSKEHAEFIVKLAEVNGFDIVKPRKENLVWFSFWDNNLGFFEYEISATQGGCKQITIPLPPECESVDETPFEVVSNGAIYKLSKGGFYALTGNGKAGVIYESASLDNLMKAKDFKILSFTSDNAEIEDIEWPKVGDTVTWGNCSHTAEVIAIHNNMAWLFTEGEYHTEIAVSKLQKPKTPEQELRDEISDLAFNQFNDDSYDLTHNSYYLAEQLISKYNITKKPQ